MYMPVNQELLDAVKNELAITYSDEETNKRITGYIESAEGRLQEIAGVPLDFNKPGLARDLLLARCRYANSQALEAFEQNYLSELISLNFSGMVGAADEN